MTLYAEVVFPLPLSQSFFYIIPQTLEERAIIGTRVLAPLGPKILMGFIVRIQKKVIEKGIKLKEIKEVVDRIPLFSPGYLSFTHQLSEYYGSSWGEFLEASLPPTLVLKTRIRISLTEKGKKALGEGNLSKEEMKLAEILSAKSYSLFFLKKRFGLKNLSSLLSRVEKKGLVELAKETKSVKPKRDIQASKQAVQLEFEFALEDGSRQAVEIIQDKIKENSFSPFYLYGSQNQRETVYFSLISRVLAQSKKVLYLTPEISFTEPLKEKFERKLGEKAAFIHSELREGQREVEWQKIRNELCEVVVGTRSALFTPLENLGLIIVDGEGDVSYYQPESPSYDARQGAWLRASEEKAVLVCGSQTPTVEAFYRARKAGYLLNLVSKDFSKGKYKVSVADEKMEKGWIGRLLKEEIKKKLSEKKRIILFLNRRGYASFLFCPKCHSIPKCARCDISLAYHKKEEKLICHYCRYSFPRPAVCPECGSKFVEPRGIGVEAVEEELKKAFPQARILSFSSDLVRSRKLRERILHSFARGRVDILVGTELLAHQINLPPVSLVGIMNPEAMLAFSDFRASQRTFQAINRMKCFIEDHPQASVIIQTAFPEHYSIRAAASHDYLAFFEQEIKFRQFMNYPPFSHMVEILFQGKSLRTLAQRARDFLAQVKSRISEIVIFGPALAPVAKLRGEYRVQVILKSQKRKLLDDILRELLKAVKAKRSIFRYD